MCSSKCGLRRLKTVVHGLESLALMTHEEEVEYRDSGLKVKVEKYTRKWRRNLTKVILGAVRGIRVIITTQRPTPWKVSSS